VEEPTLANGFNAKQRAEINAVVREVTQHLREELEDDLELMRAQEAFNNLTPSQEKTLAKTVASRSVPVNPAVSQSNVTPTQPSGISTPATPTSVPPTQEG
jgi:hypothetical protein